ncbi:MAG: rhodanese-like domain-containing protein [Proteobacteria bacterium]|nr:rhodanese-like domain-containing protein [Pseudomonadota bacterium]MBU1059258.1 rhodanese-like domain-containing protein [Pseudomonadota bacterium]
MFQKIIVVLVAVTLLATPAFSEEQVTPEQRFKQSIEAIQSGIKSIDPETLAAWIENERDFILVDVREANEVEALQIQAEDSMAVPRGVIEVKLSRKIKDLDTKLVLYCLKGDRGMLATKALTDIGYTNAYNLDGGILNWIKEGRKVSNMFGSFEMKDYVSNFK